MYNLDRVDITSYTGKLTIVKALRQLAKTTLLDELKPRSHNEIGPGDLQRMREQLDVIDAEILRLLGQRMKISRDIGTIKHEHNMPIFQPQRWQQVLDRQMQAAREAGLDEEFVRELTEKIHGESLRQQE